jgi:hypothetical protein
LRGFGTAPQQQQLSAEAREERERKKHDLMLSRSVVHSAAHSGAGRTSASSSPKLQFQHDASEDGA